MYKDFNMYSYAYTYTYTYTDIMGVCSNWDISDLYK